MEKLVAELALEMPFRYNEDGGLVNDTEKARFYIDRILSAVRDGRLKLPGEVGREQMAQKVPENRHERWDYVDNTLAGILKLHGKGARLFIALRKEEEK